MTQPHSTAHKDTYLRLQVPPLLDGVRHGFAIVMRLPVGEIDLERPPVVVRVRGRPSLGILDGLRL